MKLELADPEPLPGLIRSHELAALGEIALILEPARLFDAIDAVLERLRGSVRADACELFLADGTAREVFMVAHAGADPDAFHQCVRFAARQGFPGIVLQTGALLSTEALSAEDEFLRSRVKFLGYRSAICAPLKRGDGQVSGCLLLAWKRALSSLQDETRLVLLAARTIGTAVTAARTQARLAGTLSCFRAPDLAECFRSLTGADTAAVILADGIDGIGGARSSAPAGEPSLLAPQAQDHARWLLERCPTRACNCAQVLGGREGWPRPCLEAGCAAKARYCVPLVAGGRFLGVATSAFRERAPTPLTRTLPVALWLTEDLVLADQAGGPQPLSIARGRPEARLQIRCLGGFSVILDGRGIGRAELGREKARELLSLFVVAEGRPVPWQRLAEQLWPSSEPAAARNRFHVTLAALRSVLEPRDGGGWSYLRRDGQRYFLDPEASLCVDAWEFHERLRQAQSAETRPGAASTTLSILEEAVALYEGEAFGGEFAGSGHDAFAARQREAVLPALSRIAELRLAVGDPEGALAALRQAEAIAPVREDLQRQLMHILEALGRHIEARACYERLRSSLVQTPGIESSAAARRLYERLPPAP